MEILDLKHCPICNLDLAISEFGICRARRDGKNLYCKKDIREKVRESRRALKEYKAARKKRIIEIGFAELLASDSAEPPIQPLSKLSPAEKVREAIRKGARTQSEIGRDTRLGKDDICDAIATLLLWTKEIKSRLVDDVRIYEMNEVEEKISYPQGFASKVRFRGFWGWLMSQNKDLWVKPAGSGQSGPVRVLLLAAFIAFLYIVLVVEMHGLPSLVRWGYIPKREGSFLKVSKAVLIFDIASDIQLLFPGLKQIRVSGTKVLQWHSSSLPKWSGEDCLVPCGKVISFPFECVATHIGAFYSQIKLKTFSRYASDILKQNCNLCRFKVGLEIAHNYVRPLTDLQRLFHGAPLEERNRSVNSRHDKDQSGKPYRPLVAWALGAVSLLIAAYCSIRGFGYLNRADWHRRRWLCNLYGFGCLVLCLALVILGVWLLRSFS